MRAGYTRRRLLGALVWALTIVFTSQVWADYLEVRRSATIKDRPDRNAPILERPEVGANLQLLDSGRKVNGYYRTIVPSGNGSGWIYKTLVRRHRGDLPGAWPDNGATEDGPDLESEFVMQAHFIDVDQGDATLLEFPCGAIMIDAGGQNDDTTDHLLTYLGEFFERRTDLNHTIAAIFITHTHVDHNRALRRIVEDPSITVENYIHNGVYDGSGRHAARWMRDHANEDGRDINMRSVTQSEIIPLSPSSALTGPAIDPVECDGVDPLIRVLAAPYEENPGWPQGHFDDGNNKSLVTRIDFGESSFLFTGDLEEAAIETMVDYYDETEILDVDVYQVGHHGSYNGTTDSLMMAMTPELAVISMGPSTDRRKWTAYQYGHPRMSAVEMLDRWVDRRRMAEAWVRVARGVKRFQNYRMRDAVFATGWDGTVVITADPLGRMKVRTTGSDAPS